MTEREGNSPGTVLRSLFYYAVWPVATLPFLMLFPFVWLPRRIVWAVLKRYIALQSGLLRTICGIEYRVTGLEHLPEGPVILASRHEALWETLILPYVFDNPVVFLKEEIGRYPVVGTLIRRLGHVAVRRDWRPDAMRRDIAAVTGAVAQGRSVLIFPSGTRNPDRRYLVQGGVAVLYRTLDIPCVPIVLDSGRVWPHRSWLRRPGTVHVRLLPPIAPGLGARAFTEKLRWAMYRPARPRRDCDRDRDRD